MYDQRYQAEIKEKWSLISRRQLSLLSNIPLQFTAACGWEESSDAVRDQQKLPNNKIMQKDGDQHKHTILYEYLYFWEYILILQGRLLGQKSVQTGTKIHQLQSAGRCVPK